MGVCSHDANILQTALFTTVILEAASARVGAAAVKCFVTICASDMVEISRSDPDGL